MCSLDEKNFAAEHQETFSTYLLLYYWHLNADLYFLVVYFRCHLKSVVLFVVVCFTNISVGKITFFNLTPSIFTKSSVELRFFLYFAFNSFDLFLDLLSKKQI